MPEPWLRSTHLELAPLARGVVHALELAGEDVARWAHALTTEELFAQPHQLPPVAFQLRHMARSLDRLLTYAEGRALSETQLAELQGELDPDRGAGPIAEFEGAVARAVDRVVAIPAVAYGEARFVGRERLATTAAGLLVHCADHTQRHAGQLVTTCKVLLSMR